MGSPLDSTSMMSVYIRDSHHDRMRGVTRPLGLRDRINRAFFDDHRAAADVELHPVLAHAQPQLETEYVYQPSDRRRGIGVIQFWNDVALWHGAVREHVSLRSASRETSIRCCRILFPPIQARLAAIG